MTELDLTPREPDPGTSHTRIKRGPWFNRAIVGGLCLVLGFLVFQALTNAKVFFYNVDEAVANKAELADSTFRMQGTVVTEPATNATGAITFTVAFEDSMAEVRHVGQEPTDLFRIGQPVVVQGHWEGETFQSNQILVKHDESYVEDNPARLDYDLPASTTPNS